MTQSGLVRRAAERKLPPYLEDLAQRSTTHLFEEQTKKVWQTLAQYMDVFSRGDMDLGCMSLMKHQEQPSHQAASTPGISG